MSIYDNIADLIGDAVSETTSAFSEFDFAPPTVSIPAVDFAVQSVSAELPERSTYIPPAPPRAGITGSVDRAAYEAASTALGSLNITPLPTTLSYLTPNTPDPLPDLGRPPSPGEAPETGFVDVPTSAGLRTILSPDIDVGIPPDLDAIPELSYDRVGVSKLDLQFPDAPPVPDVEELANPEQLVVQLDNDLLSAIKNTLSGQDIVPIQEELYRLATQDSRRERVNQERELFAQSAAAGFSDSNGGLFERLADLHYETQQADVDAYGEGRDYLYNLAKEKLVVAVQQSIALETANFSVHLSYARKLVEVFEFNVALHTTLFNLIVDMYEAQVAGVNAAIQAYNSYVGAVLEEQRAELAELDVVQAKLRSNRARIDMYEAQSRTLGVQADVYETDIRQATLPIDEFTTYIDGLLQNVKIVRTNLQGYRDALDAYSESTRVDKRRIDAYGQQVRAEGSAVDVYRENWDLYAAANSALTGQNNAVGEFNRASLSALRSEIGVFQQAATQQRSYLNNLSQWVSSNQNLLSQYSGAIRSLAQYTEAHNDAEIAIQEAESRVDLSLADFTTTQHALDAQRQAAQAVIDAGLLASRATTQSGLAQAAYAIRSVSASLGSTSTDSDSRTFSSVAAEGESYTRSYSYTKTLSP